MMCHGVPRLEQVSVWFLAAEEEDEKRKVRLGRYLGERMMRGEKMTGKIQK